MKFIRDIIVERAGMVDSGAPAEVGDDVNGWETPVAGHAMPQEPEAGDFARPVGRTLGRISGNPVFENRGGADFEEDDDFDLLDDASDGASDGAVIDGQSSPAHAELFADVWGRDKVEKVIDDVFAEQPAYPTQSRLVDDAFLEDEGADHDQAAAPVEGTDPDDPSPFDRIESPPPAATSTFQRFRRRQSIDESEAQTPDAPRIAEIAPQPIAPVQVPTPAAGRARRPAGRVKTRLLGFGNDHNQDDDLFANGTNTNPAAQAMFPVGWMVIVAGPGCGTAFALQNGVSQIGRGEGQAVRLDYGDTSISRENHAAVAYDPEQQAFFLGHGGKANLVRLNGKPVLSTETLASGALIRIGETTLRFIGFCGSEFDWGSSRTGEDEHVRLG